MNKITQLYDRFFPTTKLVPAGIYHYQSPEGPNGPFRMHLRIEADGEGVLILNASTVLHLNKTAAEFAYYLVHSYSDDDVASQLRKRYKVDPLVARKDYDQFKTQLESLINTPDLDPVTFLDFGEKQLYSSAISAPYRLDCALTYRIEEGSLGYTPVDRVKQELELSDWKKILDKAWNAGIPHVIFTGGEPTLRPDLLQMILYAEKIGLVSGLMTDGVRLADPDYTRDLLLNGLDHVTVVLDTESDQAWSAVRLLLPEDISVTIHITLTEQNLPEINLLMDYLVKLGARNISFSIGDLALKEDLKNVTQMAAEKGLKLVWGLPVPYSHMHPVALELAEHDEAPQGAGKAWLYVEPDGDVLPGQGILEVKGNLLTDPWEKIWGKH